MKKFKDLKVGDIVFIGFEKKIITNIELGSKYAIIDAEGQTLEVFNDSSYEYDKYNVRVVAVDKEALVAYFEDRLKHLHTAYNMQKDYYEKMINKTKELK